jgi:energy-coupling factor transporter ATP-binding protein EcfA2
MAILEVKQLHFTFPDAELPALDEVSLSIESGSFVLLCGPTGCGKTTLLRHMKPELYPVGMRQGQVNYEGEDLLALISTKSTSDIGMVMQHPDSQIVMENVRQELVFTLENLGLPTAVIRSRMAEVAHFFGMESWLDKRTDELSGGQKQMLNLASVLLLQPRVLLLDEPTAQLDPVAAKQFLYNIQRLNRELGITIIISEHRIEDILPVVDQVVLLNQGRIECRGMPSEAVSYIVKAETEAYRAFLPAAAKLYQLFREHSLCPVKPNVPLSVKEGREWLDSLSVVKPPWIDANILPSRSSTSAEPVVLEMNDVIYGYRSDEELVLRRLSLVLRERECLALLGGNGAGKTTLLRLATGLLKPLRGEIRLGGKSLRTVAESAIFRTIGFLPQNPMTFFICDTVREELLLSAHSIMAGKEADVEIEKLIQVFDLNSVLNRHPHDLSGGERQKAALACVLLRRPSILLLDEPTKGIDPKAKEKLSGYLHDLHREGLTILMATHDAEFAAQVATWCAMLFDGEITSQGLPHDIFSQQYFYTTTINRIARHHYPYALHEEDVLRLWKDNINV